MFGVRGEGVSDRSRLEWALLLLCVLVPWQLSGEWQAGLAGLLFGATFLAMLGEVWDRRKGR